RESNASTSDKTRRCSLAGYPYVFRKWSSRPLQRPNQRKILDDGARRSLNSIVQRIKALIGQALALGEPALFYCVARFVVRVHEDRCIVRTDSSRFLEGLMMKSTDIVALLVRWRSALAGVLALSISLTVSCFPVFGINLSDSQMYL